MDNSQNVTTGIFFLFDDGVYSIKKDKQVRIGNNTFAHYPLEESRIWEKLLRFKYPTSHYYDHIRGEVAFDCGEAKYVIFISSEATEDMVENIALDFGIEDYYVMRDPYYSVWQDNEFFKSDIFIHIEGDRIDTTRICNGEEFETLYFEYCSDEFIDYITKYHIYNRVRRRIYAKNVYIPNEPDTKVNGITDPKSGRYLCIYGDGINPIYKYLGTDIESIDFARLIKCQLISSTAQSATIASLYLRSIEEYNKPLTDFDAELLYKDSMRLAKGDIGTNDYLRLRYNMKRLYNSGDIGKEKLKYLLGFLGFFTCVMNYRDTDYNLYAMAINGLHSMAYKKDGINVYPDLCDEEFFGKFLKNCYPYELKVNVLRGKNELTGNLIEASVARTKILLECGTSLANKGNELEEIEKKILSNEYAAIFITHLHKDHAGLIEKVPKHIPVFIGEKALGIYKIQYPNADTSNFVPYHDNETITISGMLSITPHLCDHSAVDSYMFELNYLDKSMLYTGDFRANGRKNFNRLLESLPRNIDTLIIEGTHAHSDIPAMSEHYIEKKLKEVFSASREPSFVLCTSTNIDRIVSIYKAAHASGKKLLVSFDEAKILSYLGGGVPNPLTFDDVYVYYPHSINKSDTFLNVKKQSLHIDDIAEMKDYVMIVSTSALPYLTKLARARGTGLVDCPFVYSLWKGYLNEEWMSSFVNEMEYMGVKTHIIHTTGHADKKALDDLKNYVNAKNIIEVHTKL